MEIRQVKWDEVENVVELYDEYDRPKAPRPAEEKMHKAFASIVEAGGCVVGAFESGRLIGTCTVNLCANLSWSARPYAIIENVIVSNTFRRHGVGKAVLQYATDFAQKAGCYKVALMTGSKDPATLRFYEAAGFSASKQGFQIRFGA